MGISTTRRGLLRTMAALPALAALSGCRGFNSHDGHPENSEQQSSNDPNAAGQLNVCLHGLWYVEVRKDGIVLYAPTVPDHVYRAGWWKQEVDLNQKTRSYELKGLGIRNTVPVIDDLQYPVLRATPTPDLSKMSAMVKVPYPDEIHGLRCLRRSATQAPFYGDGKYAPRPDLTFLPMNLILVYRLHGTASIPYLEGSSWKGPASYRYPLNLHCRAEPLQMSLMDAQVFLIRALGITDPRDLQMNNVWKKSGTPPPDPVKPLYGYERDEQLGLGELFPPSRKAADVWDGATFAEIPQIESDPCHSTGINDRLAPAAPSNCSHVIGRNGA